MTAELSGAGTVGRSFRAGLIIAVLAPYYVQPIQLCDCVTVCVHRRRPLPLRATARPR